jgi:hypothetical protein
VKLSRRAFMLMSISWAVTLDSRAGSGVSRIVVMDDALCALWPVKPQDRITRLIGDAVGLWQDHLQYEARIHGLTRPADAFVFTRLASDIGMRVTQRAIDAEAVIWSAERVSTISIE